MILKLLIGAAILIALFRMVSPWRPALRRKQAPPPPGVPRAQDLRKCPGCGVWLPVGQVCDCGEHA